ncbi:MAG: pyridoxamine 5'-phosphate oxidase [Quisquiliibacterium sp.]
MKHIAGMRKNYDKGELNEVHDEPLDLFREWFDDALKSEVPEPNAMTLATVDEHGRPSTRIVLVKGFDERGLVWYTNYRSRKGRQLQGNPHAAIQFHWVELERVVRIEGQVEKVEPDLSDEYYKTRPLASRIGAWASEQSTPVSSRAILVARAAEYGLKYGIDPPRPPHWGGYRLRPDYWEFWQGRPSRLHDRIAFARQADGGWSRARLSP